MKIYLNNFKGFTDTFIPFFDVNFFVGENSTGKTTVLKLLELFSEPPFWMKLDFNAAKHEFGNFSEIVNQYSNDRSYFEIGVEFGSKKGKSVSTSPEFRGWYKFKDGKNVPVISEFKYLFKDETIWVKIHDEKSISFCTKNGAFDSFENWIKNIDGFSESKRIDIDGIGKRDFFLIMLIIENELKRKEKYHMEKYIPKELVVLCHYGAMRAAPKRYYDAFYQVDSKEGEFIPILLKGILLTKEAREIKKEINHFGKESGMFDTIKIDNYGKKQDAPFSINVSFDSHQIKIINVGYGVSQVLPMLVEMVFLKNTPFTIQQPEIHLHPKAQAAFGNLIFKVAKDRKNKFFVETHSDFIINRFRYNIYRKHEKSLKSQVLFFQRDKNGTHVTSLPIDEKGHYPDDIPSEYGKFFIDEELKMLEF